MKKTLGTLLLLTLAPAGALLESCSDDDCRYDSTQRYYDVQGVELVAVRQATGQPLVAGETAAAADLQLEMQLEERYYGSRPGRASGSSSAYACPPAPMPGYLGTTEILDSLTVRCAYAYDAAHPAGAVVNDLLLYRGGVQALPPVPGRNAMPVRLALRLWRGPDQPGQQQFVLRCRLTNGETYTARTPVFTLR